MSFFALPFRLRRELSKDTFLECAMSLRSAERTAGSWCVADGCGCTSGRSKTIVHHDIAPRPLRNLDVTINAGNAGRPVASISCDTRSMRSAMHKMRLCECRYRHEVGRWPL
jgi:hypothetical protein